MFQHPKVRNIKMVIKLQRPRGTSREKEFSIFRFKRRTFARRAGFYGAGRKKANALHDWPVIIRRSVKVRAVIHKTPSFLKVQKGERRTMRKLTTNGSEKIEGSMVNSLIRSHKRLHMRSGAGRKGSDVVPAFQRADDVSRTMLLRQSAKIARDPEIVVLNKVYVS